MTPRRRAAFTLVELLVVMAVIAALAAITVPVVVGAKRSAKRGAQISNLRQTALGLVLYAEDNGGEPNWPTLPVARQLLDPKVTCDPLDDWRSSCKEAWDPLLGSFGYAIPNEADRTFFGERDALRGHVVLLATVFDATERRLYPFHGDMAPPYEKDGFVHLDHDYTMGRFVTVARNDMSVQRVHWGKPNYLMAWRFMFWSMNGGYRRSQS